MAKKANRKRVGPSATANSSKPKHIRKVSTRSDNDLQARAVRRAYSHGAEAEAIGEWVGEDGICRPYVPKNVPVVLQDVRVTELLNY